MGTAFTDDFKRYDFSGIQLECAQIKVGDAVIDGTDGAVLDSIGSTQSEIDAVCDQSANGAIPKIAAISVGATELGGVETDTSFEAPANGMILLGAWVNVTDNEAGATMDVGTQGTSNDPNGILETVSLATAGYTQGTVGALLNKFIPGEDPVSVTSSGDLDSCEATIYLYYLELVAAS